MSKPSDLDIRVSAMQQEFQQQIAIVSARCATYAAESASDKAKIKAADAMIAEQEAKIISLTPKEKTDGSA